MPIPDEVPDDLKLASGVIKYGTGRNRQDLVVHTPGDAGDFVEDGLGFLGPRAERGFGGGDADAVVGAGVTHGGVGEEVIVPATHDHSTEMSL